MLYRVDTFFNSIVWQLFWRKYPFEIVWNEWMNEWMNERERFLLNGSRSIAQLQRNNWIEKIFTFAVNLFNIFCFFGISSVPYFRFLQTFLWIQFSKSQQRLHPFQFFFQRNLSHFDRLFNLFLRLKGQREWKCHRNFIFEMSSFFELKKTQLFLILGKLNKTQNFVTKKQNSKPFLTLRTGN